jgi:Secretion system C-terminal sorting domain
MKKLFTLLCFLFTFSAIFGQYTTPTIDGTITAGEYGTHTTGSNQGVNFFMTWDATNLYVAVQNSNTGEAAVIYIDKNPLPIVDGGTNADGSTAGFNYDGEKFSKMPFRADFVCYVKSGYREFRNADGAGAWGGSTAGFGSFAETGGNVREIAIPWSAITGGGVPASFNWFGLVTSGGGFVFNQEPILNAGGAIGTSASYAHYYTVSKTASGAATKPFNRLSYASTGAATLATTSLNVFDFTLNTMGNVAVSDGSTLIIANNLTFSTGKITLGTGNVVAATASGGSMNSYVVTGGTGTLAVGTNGLTNLPIGTATTYDPVSVNPAVQTVFGARVSTINPAHTLSPSATMAKVGNREWDLTSAVPSPTTVTLTPGDGRVAPSGAVSLGHWTGTVWEAIAATYSGGTFSAQVSSFSPFIAAEASVPLSVELQNISAQAKSNVNIVNWATASEKSNSVFQIERSANATDFSPIGEVKGAGNSNAARNYTFTDAAPLSGVNYYRLKAVDYNGAATLSKVVSVNFAGKGGDKTVISPNPTNNVLRVEFTAADASTSTLQVTDLFGRVLLSQNVSVAKGANLVPFNVSSLPSGAYLLKANGDVTRFVKM